MYIGAIDIGGSKSIVAILDENFNVLVKDRFEGHEKDCSVHFDRLVSLLEGCAEKLGIRVKDLDALGVIPPGMVSNARTLLLAPATGWRNVDMIDEFQKRTGLAIVRTDNDVKASAIGEADLTGEPNFLWFNISNGIGSTLILNGEYYAGTHSVAGELGHCKVEYENPRPCPCGQKGCAEAMASGAAIGRRIVELANNDPEFKAMFDEKDYPLNAYGCSLLAREGKEKAMDVFREAGKYIGRALAIAINAYDPGRIFCGGGVSQSLDLMLPAIREEIERDAVEFSRNIPIEQSRLGYDTALKGAAALAMRGIREQKNVIE